MYLSMIDWHIIFVESKGSVFNDATFFNTNARSCNGDILMNLNVLDAWYYGIDNTIYATSDVNICWTLKKTFPIFRMWVCALILFSLQLITICFQLLCHCFIYFC
jgi:hypothetical protein